MPNKSAATVLAWTIQCMVLPYMFGRSQGDILGGMTLQQGLETELMGLPGDVATQAAGVDFTAVHSGRGVFTPIPTHTQPIPIHFYGFARS